jgi:serine protease AprX
MFLRSFLILFLVVFVCNIIVAQPKKYVIYFKNKATNTFTLANPAAYLSAKAIAKKIKYNIAIDSVDMPVTKAYIDSVKLVPNVTIVNTSKWFNCVIISTADANALTRISQFNFVRQQLAVNRVQNSNLLQNNIFKIEPTWASLVDAKTAFNFSYGNSETQINLHNASFLHQKGYAGNNMLISVLDNGFNTYLTHSAIDSARLQNRIIETYDFVANETSVNEDGAHGLNCLSIIAANNPTIMVGAAPKANFALYRTEDDGSEMPIEEINWVLAAERSDSAGVDVISSSVGYYDFDAPIYNYTPAQLNGNTTFASKGASIAARKGLLVVQSAGNEGSNAWQYIITPADADSVMAVAACSNQSLIASFSSKGIPTQNRIKPNVTAMGVATYLARSNNTYGFGNGTSYSAPTIAGLAACLWQAFPEYNNIKIFNAIQQSSHLYNTPNLSFGYGIPDFKKAYYILKKEQNNALYGNNWLLANPNPFNDTILVNFISQFTGNVTIQLLNANNVVVATNMVNNTEEQSWASTKFTQLQNLAAGIYTIKYTDANGITKSVNINKTSVPFNNWLIIYPNAPANSTTQIRLQAQATENISLQLVDIKGSIIQRQNLAATAGNIYTISFSKIANLPKGIYFIKVQTKEQTRVLNFIK